jgi:succinate dehydrogenase/fumarate reductase flavoprotein subunit
VVDWDLMTSLDGLFAAGGQVFFNGDHAYAAATGRYAGRRAADYAAGRADSEVDRRQIDAEKARAYAPVRRQNGIDWKELNAGVCKIMQDYCGAEKRETLLQIGLKWFAETEQSEAACVVARNPHELVRVLEVFNILTNGQMIMAGCRARRAGNSYLGFVRTDFPAMDPAEWRKWVTVKQAEDGIKAGELPLDYHGDFVANYREHAGL